MVLVVPSDPIIIGPILRLQVIAIIIGRQGHNGRVLSNMPDLAERHNGRYHPQIDVEWAAYSVTAKDL